MRLTGKALYSFLLASTALIACGSQASAQDAASPPAPAATTQAPSTSATGPDQPAPAEIVVTGSRVISSAANSPTPLTVVSTQQLLATTPTNVPDALTKLPVFLGSQSGRSTNNAGSNAAGNVLNLRNFGIQRTLVLLDGHRLAPSNANGTVDTDVLPLGLMTRVDVVTGGASAVYGSDAVTGVVNFVLDKKFTGLKYDVNGGISDYGDAKLYQAQIAGGMDLFGGRGHIEGSARIFDQQMIPISARPYAFNGQAWTQTGAGTAANPYVNTPFSRLSNQAPNGLVTCIGCAANGMQFIENGVLGPYDPGVPTGSGNVASGGDGGYDLYGAYQAGLRTLDAFGRFSYELGDHATFYVQGTAASSRNYATWYPLVILPGASANVPNTFFTNNAYLTPTAQAMLANPSGKFVLASFVNNIGGQDAGKTGRIFATDARQRYLSISTGIDGQLGRFDWDVYFTHGVSHLYQTDPSNINNQKLYAAQDAVLDSSGHPVCYVSTTPYANLYPGCVPINLFGGSSVTTSQYDYISRRTSYTLDNTMDDLAASISGDLFNLPAGPIRASLSGEMRWNKYDVSSDASPTETVDCTGLRLCNSVTPVWVQNVVAGVSARNNVYEFAAEANIPLLKDIPLIQKLDVNVAGRYTNYSTSGSVETWKVGFDYHVNDSVRFRGTASVDIRAPTLADLFAPLQQSITGFTDLLTNQTGSIPLRTQGNPNLKPEKAHTYTVGIVLTPTFVPGFTFSADYFNINLKDGITSISYGTQAIQQICLASGGSSPYCALAIRPGPITDHSATNLPIAIIAQNLNSAAVRTEGVDIEANYRFSLSRIAASLPGTLSLRGFGTYQPPVRTVNYPGASDSLSPAPAYRATVFVTWEGGGWTLTAQDRWLSSFDKKTLDGQVYVVPRVPSFNTIDLSIEKKLHIGGFETNFYLSVQNIENKQFPLYPTNTTNPGLFYPSPVTFGNAMGRYFTLGVRGRL